MLGELRRGKGLARGIHPHASLDPKNPLEWVNTRVVDQDPIEAVRSMTERLALAPMSQAAGLSRLGDGESAAG